MAAKAVVAAGLSCMGILHYGNRITCRQDMSRMSMEPGLALITMMIRMYWKQLRKKLHQWHCEGQIYIQYGIWIV